MRKLQLLGDSTMGLVIAGVLTFGLGVLALVGLLALIRELVFECCHETTSTDDDGTAGTDEVRASGRQCVTTQ
jgi:hypothetical protein